MDEFELTYLPKNLPADLNSASFKKMLDIYVPAIAEHPYLRIRKNGDKFEITKKKPVKDGDSSHQLETTIILEEAEYHDLEAIVGKRVAKTRYNYQQDGILFEIDVFEDDLKGLVLVDVEFDSAEAKAQFLAPEWLLKEVTQESFLAGGMVCGKKYSDLQNKLELFGYKPL